MARKIWRVGLGALLLIGALTAFAWFCLRGPEFRTDTGDIRICMVGIPYRYEYMPEHYRQILQKAARLTPQMETKWLRCGTVYRGGSGRWYVAFVHMYAVAAAWSAVDLRITRAAMDDVVAYMERTHALKGGTEAEFLEFAVRQSASGLLEVAPDWRDNPLATEYLRSKGFGVTPAQQ